MEYEQMRFEGVPNYGVRVTRPIGKPEIAVLDLTDRPKEWHLPEGPQMSELTAYLCGAGVKKFIYDLRGYEPVDAGWRATAIAVQAKRFSIDKRFVGLHMKELSSTTFNWKDVLERESAQSIEDAIASLCACWD